MRYGLFDSVNTGTTADPVYDRAEDAEFLAHYWEFVGDGVLHDDVTAMMEVSAQETPDMTVKVGTGSCYIKGYHGWVDEAEDLTIAASGTQDRIDRIIVRKDLTSSVRSVALAVVQGVEAATPEAPALTRNSTIHELCLADVYVAAEATTIVAANITDNREDADLCGWIFDLRAERLSAALRFGVTSGTATAYTLPNTDAVLEDGQIFTVVPHVACGDEPTLQIGAGSALPIFGSDGSRAGADDLMADIPIVLTYGAARGAQAAGYFFKRGGSVAAFPGFTYTGSFSWYDEEHTILALLTSGNLTFDKNVTLDTFLVGGGGGGGGGYYYAGSSACVGGGGGGGYTRTSRLSFAKNTDYAAAIGAGGAGAANVSNGNRLVGGTGGATSINGISAAGGQGGGSEENGHGGNGGCGGGCGQSNTSPSSLAGNGGMNGGNGTQSRVTTTSGYKYDGTVGIGQGATTRPFGESSFDPLSGGGGGGIQYSTTAGGAGAVGTGGVVGGANGGRAVATAPSGTINTGGGGGGAGSANTLTKTTGGAGGSGVILLRIAA